jgi:hypothetical protein
MFFFTIRGPLAVARTVKTAITISGVSARGIAKLTNSGKG